MKLPLNYEIQQEFDSQRFMKMRIKVMHSGLNLNNSYFSSEVMEKAKHTLANVPILAFIKKQDGEEYEDFGGHEFEIKITENDVKYVYLGRPIGIIPETNNYDVEFDDDGKQFVVVDGYVWKQYANSAMDIINRDGVKKVSMEILVDDYSWEEEYINILDYSYIGVTMLGENVREAMLGAKAEIINYSKSTISEMMEELKMTLKGGQEEMTFEEEKVEEIVEEQQEVEEFEQVEEEPEQQTEEQTEEFEEEKEEEIVTDETAEEFQEQTEQEDTIALMQKEIDELKEENARLQAFVNEVHAKAKQDAINEMFEKFEDIKEIQETIELKEKAQEMNLNDIENQLFAIRGKNINELNFSKSEPNDLAKLVTQYSVKKSNKPEWSDIVEQYKQKEGGNGQFI